jgi:cytochrome c biogenesis protein CcdA
MFRRFAERIIGVVIIFVGLALFAFGSLPLVALASALLTGKPIPDHAGGYGFGLAIEGGLAVTAYGWQCIKGFKKSK